MTQRHISRRAYLIAVGTTASVAGCLRINDSGQDTNNNNAPTETTGLDTPTETADPDTPTETADQPAEPSASIAISPSSLTVNEEVTLSAADSSVGEGVSIETYEWAIGEDAPFVAGEKTRRQSFDTPGEYAIRLRITDSRGRVDATTTTLSVEPAPLSAQLTVTSSSPTTIEKVTLSGERSTAGNGVSIETYEWDLGEKDEFVAGGETITHTFDSVGEREVRLRVTDSQGRTDTASTTLSVRRPVDEVPSLRDVTLEAVDVTDGTELQLSVTAESNTTVDWLSLSLEGPNGNIRGGGQGWEFDEVEDDVWRTEYTYTVSDEAASGEYYFDRVSVENAADLESDDWPNELSVTIETNVDPEQPTLSEVTLDTDTVSDGTELQLTVIAESNVTVNWLSLSLEGPNGNIRGGGQGWEFDEVEGDVWRTEYTYTVSDEAASGEYYFDRVSVENTANLKSDDWPNELSTTINNP